MTYSQFRNKWNLDITDISSKAYVDIKMALRNFNCPSVAQRNITQINKEVCLYFFKDARGNIKNSSSIYMRASYEELIKSAKKCEKVRCTYLLNRI